MTIKVPVFVKNDDNCAVFLFDYSLFFSNWNALNPGRFIDAVVSYIDVPEIQDVY